jgi:hypothetical protein
MLKKILLAALALTASSAALAHDGWGHQKHYRHYYSAPRPVHVVPAPRVVYAPPPPVAYPYYAAPVVVRPAPIYRPMPVYPAAPGVSIRFNFPL